MKRRKLKAAEITLPKIETLDLRSHTILNLKSDCIGFAIDSVASPGTKDVVWRDRKDPLYMIYAQGGIDEPDLIAGERWRECVELCEMAALRAQNIMREYIDVSYTNKFGEIWDRKIKAERDLKSAKHAVIKKHGSDGLDIINKVLINNMFPSHIARSTGKETGFISTTFKEALKTAGESFTVRS